MVKKNLEGRPPSKEAADHADGAPRLPGHEKLPREEDRIREDEKYVPVIIKRTDEARRHPDDILESAIVEGLEQLHRPSFSLGLSAIAGGLILGFTAMSVAVTLSALGGNPGSGMNRLALAAAYPLGFVLCIMSGAQLFTEHTATAVYPVLDRRAGMLSLLRVWGIVLLGNLVGAGASAGLLTAADEVIGAGQAYLDMAAHMTAPGPVPLLVSAILAGWLMALGAWLILATPPRISQIASIYLVTFIIGLGGLHHSIAGAVELFTANVLSNRFSPGADAVFLGAAVLGNLIGGSLFVAVLNYAHIRRSRE